MSFEELNKKIITLHGFLKNILSSNLTVEGYKELKIKIANEIDRGN